MLISVPWLRAVGGMFVRKSRADLALMEKGFSLVLISVMNLVIMLGKSRGLDGRVYSFFCVPSFV